MHCTSCATNGAKVRMRKRSELNWWWKKEHSKKRRRANERDDAAAAAAAAAAADQGEEDEDADEGEKEKTDNSNNNNKRRRRRQHEEESRAGARFEPPLKCQQMELRECKLDETLMRWSQEEEQRRLQRQRQRPVTNRCRQRVLQPSGSLFKQLALLVGALLILQSLDSSIASGGGGARVHLSRAEQKLRIFSLQRQLELLRRQIESSQPSNESTATFDLASERQQQQQPHQQPVYHLIGAHEPPEQSELQFGGRHQVALGGACLESAECAASNAHCQLESLTCSCLPQHVQLNSTSCLAPALLGFECQLDAQCQMKVAHSHCQRGKCVCPSELVAYRRDKCLKASNLNEFCLTNSQCELNDSHSYCKWRIPNVYGNCKCPPNYMLVETAAGRTKCAPRLGDICLTDAECQLATERSLCLPPPLSSVSAHPPNGHAPFYPKWQTSQTTKATTRCACAPPSIMSPNRLACQEPKAAPTTSAAPRPTTPATPVVAWGTKAADLHQPAGSDQADARHQAEVAVDGRQNEASGSPKASSISNSDSNSNSGAADGNSISSHTKVKPTKSEASDRWPEVSSGGVSPAPTGKIKMRVSSLGQSCSSSLECRARDPNSECKWGRCECRLPTAQCAANSTGCHADTFQCRNGQCISWYFVCDSFRNCDDGSDEEQCSRLFGCPSAAFQCASSGECVSRARVCDGTVHCRDASDELGCGHSGVATPIRWANRTVGQAAGDECARKRAFKCRNGQCLPAYVLCNAVEDCADGSDEEEQLCEGRGLAGLESAGSPKLSDAAIGQVADDSPLIRTSRAEMERLRRLVSTGSGGDGGHHLHGGAVELPDGQPRRRRARGAGRRPAAAAAECPADAFVCRNGRCRSSAILCSGVDGCGDNSDEEACQVCKCAATAAAAAVG